MRFKCGKTQAEAQASIDKRLSWHRWFAWRPVEMTEYRGDCRWLEYVERKQRWIKGYADAHWTSDYRSIK